MSGPKSVTANFEQTCVYTISPTGKTFSATVTATISGSGNQIINVSPASQTTDVNGQAVFAVDAKDMRGTASIRFRVSGLGNSTTVQVKVR